MKMAPNEIVLTDGLRPCIIRDGGKDSYPGLFHTWSTRRFKSGVEYPVGIIENAETGECRIETTEDIKFIDNMGSEYYMGLSDDDDDFDDDIDSGLKWHPTF